jgi:hypothetical protein
VLVRALAVVAGRRRADPRMVVLEVRDPDAAEVAGRIAARTTAATVVLTVDRAVGRIAVRTAAVAIVLIVGRTIDRTVGQTHVPVVVRTTGVTAGPMDDLVLVLTVDQEGARTIVATSVATAVPVDRRTIANGSTKAVMARTVRHARDSVEPSAWTVDRPTCRSGSKKRSNE